MKKTAERKSRDTVPLSTYNVPFLLTLHKFVKVMRKVYAYRSENSEKGWNCETKIAKKLKIECENSKIIHILKRK
jgi:hypothetical protein